MINLKPMPMSPRPLLMFVSLAVLTACGHAPPLGAPTPGGAPRAFSDAPQPVRKRGYDRDRWKQLAPTVEQPQAMPRQGPRAPKVDLRPKCPPVYDQGEIGACTAFAIAKGLREFKQTQRGGEPVPQSALWFYYEERALAGTTKEDSGATIADGMKVLTRKGSAPERCWPYHEAKFAVKPPAQAYAEAPKWKLAKAYHLMGLEDVKTSIANGHPVAMGFACYPSFDRIGDDGKMPMPGRGERPDGGHAALAVGYDDARKVLIVRNSYGKRWGDAGHFYMPYAFAADRAQVDEYWTAD